MAKLYGEIAKSALLTLDKSFSRALGQPLDASEVYYSLDAAKTYAATPAAYIGQKIVVIEDGKITHYSVEDTTGTLKELGAKPVGDGKSISVDTSGIVSILGAADADSLTLPRMKEDKSGIEWVPVSQVVEGDGNDNTTYEITALTKTTGEGEAAVTETYGIKVKIFFNDTAVEGGEFEIDFDVYTKSEADAKFLAKADYTPYDETDLKNRVSELEGAVNNETTGLGAHETRIQAMEAFWSTTEDADNVVNTLKEIQEYIASDESGASTMAGNIQKNTDAIAVLNGDNTTAGSVDKKIADAIAPLATTEALNDVKATAEAAQTAQEVSDAIDTKITAQNLGQYAKTADVNKTLEDYAKSADVEAEVDRAKAAEKVNADAITAIKDDANIDSFADVVAELAKKQNTGDYATKTEAQGYANAKDAAITEAHNLAQTGVDNAATAQQKANEAYTLADSNKTNLNSLTATVSGHTDTISEHTTKIANLGTFQTEHTALYDSLKGTVDKHTTDIAGKAAQSDLESAVSRVAANEAAIKTLNETTIPNINNTKANKDDVYTKTQIGTLAKDGEGNDKTIVQMIEDAKSTAIASATYNDTEVKEGIENNASLIETLVGSDADKSVRTIAAEEIAAQLVADDAKDSLDTLQEIAAWIQSHPNDAAAMNEDIGDLQAIVAGIGGTDEPATVIELVEQEIAAIPLATLVEGEDGAVTATEGLILPENEKFEMAAGKVTAISTDLLVQGKNTLVLCGGSASN